MSFFNISPNTIIYNSANTPYTLRKGAFCIGINDIGYSAIGETFFWNGVTPPSFTTEAVVSSSTSANGLFLGAASALSMVQIGWYANGPEVPNGIVTEITESDGNPIISIVPANVQMQFQSGESYTFTTNVPTGQTYTIYNTSEGTSEPSIRVANNYNQAVQQFTNLGMPNGTTYPFVWAAENNNILVINFNYPDIQIPNGDTLVMHLDSSFIASLPLPEAINPIPSGIKWYDVSWEPNNSVDFVIGEGGAVSFNGSAIILDGNSYASVIEEASIPIGNSQYTINVWFNPSDFTGENAFVGWGNYGTTNEVNAFRLINNTGLVNYWWDVDLSVNYSFTTDTWYNATCSFDGTTRKIYVNGVLLGSDEPAGHNVPDATNLTVGYAGIGSESFIGSMQVLSIYNTALTDAQVLSSYQAMLPRFTIPTTTTTTSTTSTTTTICAPFINSIVISNGSYTATNGTYNRNNPASGFTQVDGTGFIFNAPGDGWYINYGAGNVAKNTSELGTGTWEPWSPGNSTGITAEYFYYTCPTTTTTSTTTSTTTAAPTTTTSTTTTTQAPILVQVGNTALEACYAPIQTSSAIYNTATFCTASTLSSANFTTLANGTYFVSYLGNTINMLITGAPTTLGTTDAYQVGCQSCPGPSFLVGFGSTPQDACAFLTSSKVYGDNVDFCSNTTFFGSLFSNPATGFYNISYDGNILIVSTTNGSQTASVVGDIPCSLCSSLTTTTTSTTSTTTTIAAPTATTDGYANLTPNTAQITGTIVSNGGSTITERGIVYSISPNPTIANNKVSDGAGNPDALGEFIHTYTITGTNGNTCYLKIYATNAVGTSYGAQVSFSLPCFIKGTKITLASGLKKNIEDISYEDSLLVWNFDEGRFDSANPIWIMTPVLTQYVNIIFSDGSKLGISGHLNHDGGHRIFNLDKGEFTYAIPNEHSPIGTRTFNDKGDIVTIVGKEESSELEEIYNVVTNYHLNIFAEGILTSRRLNNLYPIADMKFIKDERSITSIEEFKGVPTEYYEGLRLGEQPLAINSEGFLVKTPGELAYTLPTISELTQWTIEFINKRL